jgi:hypothetical protein
MTPDPDEHTPRPAPTRGRSVLVGIAKFLLGLGLVVGLIAWLGPSWSDVSERLELRPLYLLVGFVGTLLATAVTAARWKILTEVTSGGGVSYASFFHVLALTRFLGQFSSVLVMDLIGRSVALRAAGNQRGLGLLITPLILERVLDLVIPLAMLAWAWAIIAGDLEALRWTTFALVSLALFAVAIPLLAPMTRVALGLYARLRRLRNRDTAPVSGVVTLSKPLAARVAALSMLRYGTVVLQFFGMGAAAGIVLDARSMLSAAPVAMLSGLVGITPGGLGIQEAGWAGALHWLGHDDATIALFVLATRTLIIVNFGVLSLLSLPFSGRRRRGT